MPALYLPACPGAAVADAGGLGNVEIKAMKDAGYDTDFSVGITAASSIIGPIIPPSLPSSDIRCDGRHLHRTTLCRWSCTLFADGFLTDDYGASASKIRNYPKDDHFRLPILWSTFKRACLPLMTPVIIVGG